MEERNDIDRMVVIIVSIAEIGLIAESINEGWEFWIPLVIFGGLIGLWGMFLSQYADYRFREGYYLAYAMMGAFFHGVHKTSFFDVAVVIVMMLVTFTICDRPRLLNHIMTEYAVIMIIQMILAFRMESVEFDSTNIARLLLHIVAVLSVFLVCKRVIKKSNTFSALLEESNEMARSASHATEDFLTNISHELRTPVNVVNGMSTLILQREKNDEIMAIKDAGRRLSNQIDDILDHTEIERDELILEEDKYMIASLVNDVIVDYRTNEKVNDLELVVDIDPLIPNMMKGDYRKILKVFRHIIDNAVKFTREGGIYIRMYATEMDYGVNLNIDVTDTGIGMTRAQIAKASSGLYQANTKRNRSTGGIGLGLNVVYGFVHRMGGFVKLESEVAKGTTVHICIPQEVVDSSPCLSIDPRASADTVFYVTPDKYSKPELREFNTALAVNLARGLGCPLFTANNKDELENMFARKNVTHIFMGREEYDEDPEYFDGLMEKGYVVAVSAPTDFRPREGSRVIVMPKPLFGIPITKVLNEGIGARDLAPDDTGKKPYFKDIKALIVDDEPMNLVVATGLFRDYKMITETAASGKEAIKMYKDNDYDLVFMDHMMPEMDGVEAMKRIRDVSKDKGKNVIMVALTANVVSGAREMFLSEGFDGFLPKPIDIGDFERVMKKVLPETSISYEA